MTRFTVVRRLAATAVVGLCHVGGGRPLGPDRSSRRRGGRIHAISAADELDIALIRPDESLRLHHWVVRVGDAADIELPLQAY